MSMTETIKEMFGAEGDLKNLHDTFVDMLRDIYDAEHRILQALPTMADSAQSTELSNAFKKHQAQTESQVDRLDQVFDSIGEEPERKTCEAIKGLLAEGEEVMGNTEEPAHDAALAAAAQAVEHYEIARYGTLCAWAQEMGHTEAVRLLKQTLAEEESTDEALTRLAEKSLNSRAAEGLGTAHAAGVSGKGRGRSGASTTR